MSKILSNHKSVIEMVKKMGLDSSRVVRIDIALVPNKPVTATIVYAIDSRDGVFETLTKYAYEEKDGTIT